MSNRRLRDFVESRPSNYSSRLLAKQAKKRGIRANSHMVRRIRQKGEDNS